MNTDAEPRGDAHDGTPATLRGDCGVLLQVYAPCPDDDGHLLRCGCGAEALPVDQDERCRS
jgi:hypothetical protein